MKNFRPVGSTMRKLPKFPKSVPARVGPANALPAIYPLLEARKRIVEGISTGLITSLDQRDLQAFFSQTGIRSVNLRSVLKKSEIEMCKRFIARRKAAVVKREAVLALLSEYVKSNKRKILLRFASQRVLPVKGRERSRLVTFWLNNWDSFKNNPELFKEFKRFINHVGYKRNWDNQAIEIVLNSF